MDHIPRSSELVRVANSGYSRPDILPYIEAVFDIDEFWETAEAYKLNGGVTGRRTADNTIFTQFVIEFDDKREGGNKIGPLIVKATDPKEVQEKGYLFSEVMDKVNVALRRRCELDENGKAVGVNTKRYALLAHKR